MAHPDLDRLLNFCLPFAKEMLQKRGALYPFGASIGSDGELKPLAAYSGEGKPSSRMLVDQVTDVLKSLVQKDEIVATALCYDGLVTVKSDPHAQKKDAITLALEHASGESVVIYLPYNKKLLRGYSYESLIAVAGEHKFFLRGGA